MQSDYLPETQPGRSDRPVCHGLSGLAPVPPGPAAERPVSAALEHFFQIAQNTVTTP